MAKITIIGLYNYGKSIGDDLFSGIQLPSDISKDMLEKAIVMRGGDFEVLYPDYDFMKEAIAAWSYKWQHTILRWDAALKIEYNPLENYDRMEEYTDNKASSKVDRQTNTGNDDTIRTDISYDNENSNGTQKANSFDISASKGEGNTQENVFPFDSSSDEPKSSTASNSAGTNNAYTGTDASNAGEVNKNTNSLGEQKTLHSENNDNISNGAEVIRHTARLHGNIGVTTSQQMLESELMVARFNIVEEIAELFLRELTIPIY